MKFDYTVPRNILKPLWVTGITDAEGNFSISYDKYTGKIFATFKVSQKGHSKGILFDLQVYFGCGAVYIENKKEDSYKFTVSRHEDLLTKVIPHFDKYVLITSKYLDYCDWKRAIDLFKDKSRKSNLTEIVSIKEGMNKNRSFEDRWHHFKDLIVINPSWLQAFIDGEGSFQFTFTKTTNRDKPYSGSYACLEIAQSSHDIILLASIQKFFDAGSLKPKYDIWKLEEAKKSRSVNRFRIYDTHKICSFMDNYNLYTRKLLDYFDWKELVRLKNEKAHKTEEGKLKMIEIQNRMNSNRCCSVVNLKPVSSVNNLNSKKSYHTKVKTVPDKKVTLFIKVWRLIKSGIYVLFLLLLAFFSFIAYLLVIAEESAEGDPINETKSNIDILPVSDTNLDDKPENNYLSEPLEQIDFDYIPTEENDYTPWQGNVCGGEPFLLTSEEENRIEYMKLNMEAFLKNRGVEILSDMVEPAEMVRVRNLLLSINNSLDGSIPIRETDSELYERVVKEIRSGNVVEVYTPTTDSSFDVYQYFTRTCSVTGEQVPVQRIRHPDTAPTVPGVTYETHREITQMEISNGAGPSNAAELNEKKYVKNCFIITTTPVGDKPLPLPSWHELGPRPANDEPQKVHEWLKDLAVQRYWTSKFPFLNEHYEQLTLEKRVNDWTAGLQKANNVLEPETDVFELYDNIGLDKLFKEESNLLETNENLYLDDLFKEELNTSEVKEGSGSDSLSPEETNLLNTDEDLNIDELFK